MTALITTVLILTVKVLKVVLVVGLVAGSVAVAKKYLFGDEKIDFSFITGKKTTTGECASCKVTLQAEHKFCPGCGTAKDAVTVPKA